MAIRAIFLDLDGVLVDAADWHKEAFLAALLDVGCEMSPQEHDERFNGLSTKGKIAMLVDEGRLSPYSIVVERLHREKQARTRTLIEERCKLNPRVVDVVRYANSLVDGNVCVVTNCSRQTAHMMLRRTGFSLDVDFKLIFTNENFGDKIKPSPYPYVLARQALGIGPYQALVVDDTIKGIRSALGAQCIPWWLKRFEDLTVYNLLERFKRRRI